MQLMGNGGMDRAEQSVHSNSEDLDEPDQPLICLRCDPKSEGLVAAERGERALGVALDGFELALSDEEVEQVALVHDAAALLLAKLVNRALALVVALEGYAAALVMALGGGLEGLSERLAVRPVDVVHLEALRVPDVGLHPPESPLA